MLVRRPSVAKQLSLEVSGTMASLAAVDAGSALLRECRTCIQAGRERSAAAGHEMLLSDIDISMNYDDSMFDIHFFVSAFWRPGRCTGRSFGVKCESVAGPVRHIVTWPP